jgi:hypothetical protein
MRKLWKIIEFVEAKKMMVRFSAHPGGHISLRVYDHATNTPHNFECPNGIDQLETEVVSKLGYLIPPSSPLPSLPGLPKL